LFNSVDRTLPPDTLQMTWSEDPLIRWNRVARAVLESAHADAATEARLLAVLNVALSDALVAAKHWCFKLGSWRAINVQTWEELDGKALLPGEQFVSVSDGYDIRSVRQHYGRILIPPQRDFPSVAATLAGAAQAALAGCWKTDRVAFTLTPSGPSSMTRAEVARSYTSFSEAAREAAFVASLDGRHCREACVSGYQLGAAIGAYAGKRSAPLRP
jgi:hypothetical protein